MERLVACRHGSVIASNHGCVGDVSEFLALLHFGDLGLAIITFFFHSNEFIYQIDVLFFV